MRNAREGDLFMKQTTHIFGFTFTDKQVNSFFEKYPDCNQKINAIAHSYFDRKTFEETFIRLKSLAKGTPLENNPEFANITLFQRSILSNTKASLIMTILQDLFFKADETEISEKIIFSLLTAYLVEKTFMDIINSLIASVTEVNNHSLYQETGNLLN